MCQCSIDTDCRFTGLGNIITTVNRSFRQNEVATTATTTEPQEAIFKAVIFAPIILLKWKTRESFEYTSDGEIQSTFADFAFFYESCSTLRYFLLTLFLYKISGFYDVRFKELFGFRKTESFGVGGFILY